MKIRVAQIKVYPEKGRLRENYELLMSVLDKVRHCMPDVVVTPECFLDGYVCTESHVNSENIFDYAIDPGDSCYVEGVSAWARQQKSWFIFGCMRKADGQAYNSSIVLDRSGTIKGFYDKTHCQTHDKKYAAGNHLNVFEGDFGTFGVMICADRRWPETVRTLATKGATVIFNPTYGMHDERNRHMMQTRSFESEVYIAFTHPRQSLLTGPTGDIVCNLTENDEQFAISEIDLGIVGEVRMGESAHLKDRRSELYQ